MDPITPFYTIIHPTPFKSLKFNYHIATQGNLKSPLQVTLVSLFNSLTTCLSEFPNKQLLIGNVRSKLPKQ